MRLLFLLAALAAAPALAQTTGLPDPTFGAGGRVTLDPSGTLDSGASDVAVLPDGRVVLAGRAGADAVVIRLTAAGALDATFGTAGVVRVPLGGPRAAFAAVAVRPDGSVLAAGASQEADDTPTGAAVVRLTAAGALDATFGTAGIVREPVAAASAFSDLAVQPDGRVVAVGQAEDAASGSSRFVAVRYLAGGARDAAFGTGGRTSPDAVTAPGNAAALDGQGRLVVTGTAGTDLFGGEIQTSRLTAAGALDATFATGGVAVAPLPAGLNLGLAVVVDAGGRATVGGAAIDFASGEANLVLVRYTAAGAPDPSFGTNGVVRTGTFAPLAIAFDLALQSDGKLLVGGTAGSDTQATFLLARYTAAGALDTAFGTGGRTLFNVGEVDTGLALAFEPTGRVVLAGLTGTDDQSETRVAVARFTTDGRPTAGDEPAVPGALALAAAPNPFRDASAVTLTLGAPGAARVAVYDALGRCVAVLHDGPLAAGARAFRLDGSGLAPGLYVVRAEGAAGAAAVRVVRR